MDSFGKMTMSCDQVEAIVLDLDREGAVGVAERAAAITHLANCSRCAGLQESWQAAREELRQLAEETLAARAPERVELRLRQEFRVRHSGLLTRRGAAVAAWALAAAAVLAAAVGVWNWQEARHTAKPNNLAAKASGNNVPLRGTQSSNDFVATTLIADDSGDFTVLPGSTIEDADESAILHVRMQRGSLGVLGLPVNEQRAADWIQVDLLVGNDGLPQAVRLAQEDN